MIPREPAGFANTLSAQLLQDQCTTVLHGKHAGSVLQATPYHCMPRILGRKHVSLLTVKPPPPKLPSTNAAGQSNLQQTFWNLLDERSGFRPPHAPLRLNRQAEADHATAGVGGN